MNTLISITQERGITTVEAKKDGRYGIASGKTKGFPLLLLLRAFIRAQLPGWLALFALEIVIGMAIWGCVDISTDPRWPVQLFWWTLVAVLIVGGMYLFNFFLQIRKV